jgi:hypothetical protein
VVTPQKERMLLRRYEGIAAEAGGAENGNHHIDIPFSMETQRLLLREAGFGEVEVIWQEGEVAIYVAWVEGPPPPTPPPGGGGGAPAAPPRAAWAWPAGHSYRGTAGSRSPKDCLCSNSGGLTPASGSCSVRLRRAGPGRSRRQVFSGPGKPTQKQSEGRKRPRGGCCRQLPQSWIFSQSSREIPISLMISRMSPTLTSRPL